MENLLQIKDLFPQNKIDSYNSKEDMRLKSRPSDENKFKDFSQALNKRIQSDDSHSQENKNHSFTQKDVDKNVTQPVEEVKEEPKNEALETQENLEEQLLFIPLQVENSNKININLEAFGQDKEEISTLDETSLNPIEDTLAKNFEETTDDIPEFLPENIQPKKDKDLSFAEEKTPINHEKKEKITELPNVPFVLETQKNFPEIKPEEGLTENNELNQVFPKEAEAIENNLPQEVKHKLMPEKDSSKISVTKLKDLMANNTFVPQKPVGGTNKFDLIKNLDLPRSFGTDHAAKEGKIKVGIVSTKQINSFNIEGNHKHRIPEQNVQQALESSSNANMDNRISSSRQESLMFKQEENSATPKIVMQKYDEARQNYTDSVSGLIAAISEQMDELKKVRRNSLNVKIDLANGESLNCQLILSKENLNVRFPSIAEAFKTKILEHWDQLKQFAEERNFNLSTPYFANPLTQ